MHETAYPPPAMSAHLEGIHGNMYRIEWEDDARWCVVPLPAIRDAEHAVAVVAALDAAACAWHATHSGCGAPRDALVASSCIQSRCRLWLFGEPHAARDALTSLLADDWRAMWNSSVRESSLTTLFSNDDADNALKAALRRCFARRLLGEADRHAGTARLSVCLRADSQSV